MPRDETWAERFSASQMLADAGRMWRTRWRSLSLVVLVLTILPILATPWTQSPRDSSAAVRGAYFLLAMVAPSVRVALIVAIAFGAEVGVSLAKSLRWRGLCGGILTAAAIGVIMNWAMLLRAVTSGPDTASWLPRWVALAMMLSVALVGMYWGVAISVAVCEQRGVLSSAARSSRLLNGLRWRAAGLNIAYLMIYYFGGVGIGLVVRALPSFLAPISWPAARFMAAMISVPFELMFLAVYLQARRLADGPTVAEVDAVFA